MSSAISRGLVDMETLFGRRRRAVRRTALTDRHSLLLIGTTVATWDDELVERLTGRFVIRYDLRDTGRSTTVHPTRLATRCATSSPTPSVYSTGSASPARTSWASRPAVSSRSSWRWTTRRGSPRSRSAPARSRRAWSRRPARALPGDHGPLRQRSAGRLDDRTSILDGAVAAARVLSGSPQFDAGEARAHAAGILDRSGPDPASARNGLLSMVFSKLDCTPRWRERLPEITAPHWWCTAQQTRSSRWAMRRRWPGRSPAQPCSSSTGSARNFRAGHTRRWPRRYSRTRRSSPVGARAARRADLGSVRRPSRSSSGQQAAAFYRNSPLRGGDGTALLARAGSGPSG